MKKAVDWKRLFVVFLLIWLVINVIQAIFTEMTNDEAYYALYGENLAWGYFDHPPMVGLMTCLSSLLFGGNLAVRFLTILLQGITLILVWKMIAEPEPSVKKVTLFFILAASFVMFQVYGFVTTPDVPFLFFTAFFLFIYKRFLEKESGINTLLLALAMAGMVYSKYHAGLIIGFIVLSNLRLLTRYKFWLAGCIALLLLIPHFRWQILNDFPSFKYHLSDRNNVFKWSYFFEYLPNQLAVFNPFTLGAVVYVFIKYKPRDIFERGLYFLTVGFITFFWISSFRGHVEPHWTVACSIPMIVLLYCRSLENPKLMRYVKHWILPSIGLILIARILLLAGLLPEKLGFSGKAAKNRAIEKVAGDLPVVFTGSFQGPSNYHFFTGKESFVLSSITSRQTQFDLWEKELKYQGKPVYICNSPESYVAANFQSVNRIKIDYTLPAASCSPGDTLRIPFTMHNSTGHAVDFQHPVFPVACQVAYMIQPRKGQLDFAAVETDIPLHILPAGENISGHILTVVPDLPPQEYQLTITLVNSLGAARNSEYKTVKIAP